MKFLQVQLTPNKTTRAGNYPLIVSNDPAQCSIDTFTQESLITPDNIFIDLANNGVLQIPPDELEEIPEFALESRANQGNGKKQKK
jgi:hypothetical protein